MDKLIGKSCGCEFDMPATEWPVPGYPAWIVVLSVDMPMIEMRSQFGGAPFWINASKIKRVWDTTPNVLGNRLAAGGAAKEGETE